MFNKQFLQIFQFSNFLDFSLIIFVPVYKPHHIKRYLVVLFYLVTYKHRDLIVADQRKISHSKSKS